MWLDPILVQPPAEEPFTLAAAKLYLRAGEGEDTVINDVIGDARDHVERYTGARMITQTVELRASSFDDLDHLSVAPVQSVTSVAYIDANGAPQTLDPSLYELFGGTLSWGIRPAFGQRWPSTRRRIADAVKVTAVVGFGKPSDVPKAMLRATRLLMGDYYASREDTIAERGVTPATLPNGVDALLANFRV